jgi:NADH-quinone oxidoreductase subunit E
MSDNSAKMLYQLVSEHSIHKIDEWVAKYPQDRKQSAVMAALRIVQEEKGYLQPEWLDAVAEYLGMPPIAVYEVAAFYTMYASKPQGKHVLNVCTSISCWLRGSQELMAFLEEKLDIKSGETTADGRFTLKPVECLGACVHAPMMRVDKVYHENLTPQKVDAILECYE